MGLVERIGKLLVLAIALAGSAGVTVVGCIVITRKNGGIIGS